MPIRKRCILRDSIQMRKKLWFLSMLFLLSFSLSSHLGLERGAQGADERAGLIEACIALLPDFSQSKGDEKCGQ